MVEFAMNDSMYELKLSEVFKYLKHDTKLKVITEYTMEQCKALGMSQAQTMIKVNFQRKTVGGEPLTLSTIKYHW